MPTEVAWLLHERVERIFSAVRTDKSLLYQLQLVGADVECERQQVDSLGWKIAFFGQSEA